MLLASLMDLNTARSRLVPWSQKLYNYGGTSAHSNNLQACGAWRVVWALVRDWKFELLATRQPSGFCKDARLRVAVVKRRITMGVRVADDTEGVGDYCFLPRDLHCS
jgi:hypothetical protein